MPSRTSSLPSKQPPPILYRLGRLPDPWQAPDWSRAHSDGTFGNRFDDPERYYRVLYAATQELSCFVETLACFRNDLNLLEELRAIEGDDDFFPLGTVPRDWCNQRMLGAATVLGDYADIYSLEWVSFLRRELASYCVALGITELDAGTLQRGSPKRITQLASLQVYLQNFDGIYYRSRYGHDLENWALFEPFQIHPGISKPVLPDDPILSQALTILGLKIAA